MRHRDVSRHDEQERNMTRDRLTLETRLTLLPVDLVLPKTQEFINQNEKNKVSSTLLSLRLDAQPTVTY